MLSPTKILGCQKLLVGKFSSIVAKNPLWINLGGGKILSTHYLFWRMCTVRRKHSTHNTAAHIVRSCFTVLCLLIAVDLIYGMKQKKIFVTFHIQHDITVVRPIEGLAE